ncbi:MAG: hypothetical protein AAF743_03960 [Planctomycetota bacterium]
MWVLELLGPIEKIETIATGSKLRVRDRLVREYGKGRWRKMKGVAQVLDVEGETYDAEIHWYEAHGIGRVEVRVKAKL